MPERYPPDDPREWINRAYSDLAIVIAESVVQWAEGIVNQLEN